MTVLRRYSKGQVRAKHRANSQSREGNHFSQEKSKADCEGISHRSMHCEVVADQYGYASTWLRVITSAQTILGLFFHGLQGASYLASSDAILMWCCPSKVPSNYRRPQSTTVPSSPPYPH